MGEPATDRDHVLKAVVSALVAQRHDQALKALKRLEQLEPGSAWGLYLKGVVRMQAGALDKALELMQQAVVVDPALYAAHFHIGLLLFNDDQDAAAAEAWKALEPLGPDHPLVLFTKGIWAWAVDDFDICRKHLNRGLELGQAQGLFDAPMRQILAWVDEEERERRGEVDDDESVKQMPAPSKALIKLPPLPGSRPLKRG